MTHKYLYIREDGALLSETSPIYIVMIGTSSQANRDYLFLTSYAVEHGHFFQLWNRETAFFLSKIIEEYPNQGSRLIKISARQLVRNLKANLESPLTENQLRNQIHLQKVVDTYFRITSSINAKRAK